MDTFDNCEPCGAVKRFEFFEVDPDAPFPAFSDEAIKREDFIEFHPEDVNPYRVHEHSITIDMNAPSANGLAWEELLAMSTPVMVNMETGEVYNLDGTPYKPK